jgi:prophage DNA circulation protein
MSILSEFQSLLQQAYWRGIPFLVDAQQVSKGRKLAVHDYPFRDGGWTEDLGRKQRVFRFTGHLVGNFAPAMQVLLDTACELPGPGLLIHPTLGAMNVALLSCSTAVRADRMRVIDVEFEFVEQGTSLFPSIITSTLNNVVGAVSNALSSFGMAIAVGVVVAAAASGIIAVVEGSAVVGSLGAASTAAATDPGALVALATALPPPDDNTSYGRYANRNAMTRLTSDTTIASLQAQIAGLRSALAAAIATAQAAALSFSAANAANCVSTIAAVVETARSTMSNPGDQVRTLLNLATFSYTDSYGGAGIGDDAATVRDAFAATCRRCVLASLALAAANYQPLSYQDAVELRCEIAAALDVEITAAGDAGDDNSYTALKTLRAAVIQDLTTRAASLPLVITVTLQSNMPSLVVAYRVYRDASRSDEIAAETNVIHPAFMPTSMQILAS